MRRSDFKMTETRINNIKMTKKKPWSDVILQVSVCNQCLLVSYLKPKKSTNCGRTLCDVGKVTSGCFCNSTYPGPWQKQKLSIHDDRVCS